jgi:asparagine synthase (glutamine-hydrolysing)
MLGGIASRGDRSEIHRDGESALAVTRFDWEMTDGFSGQTLIANDRDVSVVADATLYYRDDLLRALEERGVRPSGTSPSHLIAAAYRAWGVDCVKQLEGDFAFVVYDRATRSTFAARDFMGRRPLYYAELGNTLLVASTVRAIVAHPDCPNEFDVVALAEIAGVSLAGHERTPYAAVRALPPAMSLTRDAGARVRLHSYWTLPLGDEATSSSFDDASTELRDLLGAAVNERCAPTGPTAIWLSGGWDSPVMYGIGNAARDRIGRSRLRPVSFSYPVNDPAREDELIDEITKFWNAQPKWLSIDNVPLLEDAVSHASAADIPLQHAFENWLRALVSATQGIGARVAFYGDGGDQLFAVSTIFFQDLFAKLRWLELGREWRAFGNSWDPQRVWSSVARPVLSDWARDRRGLVRQSFAFPPWMNREFIRANGLDARQAEAEATLAAGGGGRSAAETRRALLNPLTPRVLASLSGFGLESGVETRAPLLDRRIVEFACRRPRSERASGGAVKHLLRSAAKDLLPPTVLEPRKEKTGVLTGYFARSFRSDPGDIVSDTFSSSQLVEMGIVDAAALQQAWHEYKTRGTGPSAHLFMVFQTELWLSARATASVEVSGNTRELIRMPAASFLQSAGPV